MKLVPTNRMFEGLTTQVFNRRGEPLAADAVIDLATINEADKAHYYEKYAEGDLIEYVEPVAAKVTKQTTAE